MSSRSPHRRLRRRSAALLSASFAITLAAAASATATNPAAAAPLRSAIPAGTVLNVGDQEQSLETLFQASGEDKNLPYKLNFVEFDSGPLVDAGLGAGRIDLGSMGDTPATVAVSSHLPVKAVLVDLPIGASSFLLAKPGITSIAQLRGKKVAFTTGTAQQAFALRALATAGLTAKDVTQVDVTLQQLGTVIESGNADASVLSIEYKTDYLEQQPKAKVLADNATAKPPAYSYVLGTTKALDDPAKLAAIKDFARRYIQANAWKTAHKSQFIKDYYVDVEHQTTTQAKTILAAGGLSNFVPISSSVQGALQKVVQLLASSKAIPSSFSVAPLYSPTFSRQFNQILEQAKS
jgi:sulfonate transport system substrate-binding protein